MIRLPLLAASFLFLANTLRLGAQEAPPMHGSLWQRWSFLHGCRDCKKGAKTLFAWQVGRDKEEGEEEEPKENGDAKNGDDKNGKENGNGAEKNGNGGNGNGAKKKNGKEDEPEEPDEIATDRPDFTESSKNVGKGRVQLECGYTYSRNRDQGVQHEHSYPEVLLRVGLFADWLELRVGQNFGNSKNFDVDGGAFNTSGGEDMYLGLGIGLTEQKGIWPESRILIQTTVPTGPEALTAGRMLPGINYLYGWDINDFLNAGGSTQGNAAVDDEGNGYFEIAQSFTIGYALTKKLSAYTEWFAFFPHGNGLVETFPEYYFDGGFTYKFTPNFQYDIRAGVGLNRHADDFFIGSGFAVRY